LTAPQNDPIHPSLPSGLRLGSPFGIALRLHWSFLLLGGWLVLGVFDQTRSLTAVLAIVGIVVVVFGSVALHEYGHALVARHYGIGTREITLLPFGGIAQLERSPTDPRHELWIALAGPAVNFALVALTLVGVRLFGAGASVSNEVVGQSATDMALRVNLIMGVFNLVPAFPMDGGRVLRALLSMRVSALRATRIAAVVGQGLAGAMMGYGLLGGRIMLAVIGGFVWMSARAELRRVEIERLLRERAMQRARAAGMTSDGPSVASPDGVWTPDDGTPPPPGIRTVGSGTTRRS